MYDLKKLRVGDRLVRGRCSESKHVGVYLGMHSGEHIIAENSPHFGVYYANFDRFLKGHPLEYIEHFQGSDHQRLQIAPFIRTKIGSHFDLATYNSAYFKLPTEYNPNPTFHCAVFFGNLQYTWYRPLDLQDAC